MRRLIPAVALLLLGAAVARAEPPIHAELPLGPYVREGRPVLVRVTGGAERVRAARGPWASPAGAAGDEFLLQGAGAPGGVLALEVERASGSVPVEIPARRLPPGGTYVGVVGGTADRLPPGSLALPTDGLPTCAEGWLLVDSVEGDPRGAEAREALRSWRDGPRPGDGARRAFVPHLLPPDLDLFLAMAEASGEAPRVPSDVRGVLLAVAAAEILLALVVVLRREAGRSAAVWLAAPPLLASIWLLASARLPGPVRVVARPVDGPADRLVLVHLGAAGDGSVDLRLPDGAGLAAAVGYMADDPSLTGSTSGNRIRADLRAGEARMFVYRLPPVGETPRTDAPADEPLLAAWLARLGLEPVEASPPPPPADLPRGEGGPVLGLPGVRVAPGN